MMKPYYLILEEARKYIPSPHVCPAMILGVGHIISLIDAKPKFKKIFKKQRHGGLVLFLKYSQEVELFTFSTKIYRYI